MPHRSFTLIAGYHFPWDVPVLAVAGGSGAILASLITIQPFWLILLVSVGFDGLMGVFAARKERTFSFRVTEDRALTNLAILGLSKFFYFLSDNAQHMHASAGMTDVYPFGDWVAWSCLLLIVRSVIGHMAVFGVKIPWLTDWLDSLSAKSPLPQRPVNDENLAGPESILRERP